MKKIFTPGFCVLISIVSFVNGGHHCLNIFEHGNTNVKVTVDNNRFDRVHVNRQPGRDAYNNARVNNDKCNFSIVCNAFSSNDCRSQVIDFVRTCQ